uniref:Receptor-like serine/threonine-protein kinase n=1 Tax=Kalanchoe fedtschenkoi TaxID=63787 RepID=A0A7N0UN80_KALFE
MSKTRDRLRLHQPVYLVSTFFLCAISSLCSDIILPGQSLSGNQTISSKNGVFELGFFTPGTSGRYYIGIWYKNQPIRTTVWVANRKHPIGNPFMAALKLYRYGTLVLLNESNSEIWSTNSSTVYPNATSVALLDTGNLVVTAHDVGLSNVIWESFDHPTNTWLPGGKVGYKKHKQEEQNLVPWRSLENPAPGRYSVQLDKNGSSHLLSWNGSKVFWSSGPWNGKFFSQVPEVQLDYYIKNMTYITTDEENYFTYEAAVNSTLTRFIIDVTGQLKQFVWPAGSKKWIWFWARPEEQCEVYAYCGTFTSCNRSKIQPCDCLKGFEPTNRKDWELEDHSDGCVRKSSLQCENGGRDAFYMLSDISFPDNQEAGPEGSFKECEVACFQNCSCSAYAFENDACTVWKGDLLNLQQLSDGSGKSLYIRLAVKDIAATENTTIRIGKGKQKQWRIIVIGSVAAFLFLAGFMYLVMLRWRKCSKEVLAGADLLLTVYKFSDLKTATKNFSEKLGEGAFGSVFKGALPNATLIAVKELKCLANRAEKQFRAEVSTIGTIRHVNLVRLHGFCAEATKRYLVYEFVCNGSLNTILFRNTSHLLDWKARYHIAIGVAKGLTYLHEECRDRIVHCDIKPENILLDGDFNAKIADFGLAKLIDCGYSRAWTTFRGTKGYLAPEWISGEPITPKADVFSYGMLLLEMISGRRNSETADNELDHYFPKRVLDAIRREDSEVSTLLDDRLEGSADLQQLVRACRVSCWCIQDDEKDRPTMGKVVQILEGFSDIGIPPVPRFIQCLSSSTQDKSREALLTSSELGLSSSS